VKAFTHKVVVVMVANNPPLLRFERESPILFLFVLFLQPRCGVRCQVSSVFLLFCGACLLFAVLLLSHLPIPSVESWVRYVLDLWIIW